MHSLESSNAFECVPKRVGQDDEATNRLPTLRFHRVAPGETLTKISEELYGDESFWVFLYGANEAAIRNAGGLRPGLTLYVPFL